MIKLNNTVTGKKEDFIPLKPNNVLMYVCGITPYDLAHIGHGRVYVSFDVLYRLFKFLGFSITYCRNFTDIDDKILKKAQVEFGNRHRYADITKRYIDAYHEDMKALGCLLPEFEPRVTDNVPLIITFIQGLIDAGKAYESGGDVYFSIDSFPAYGILSKHKVQDLRAGARVEINEKKRDPLDFALWKSEPEGEFWQSPWGWGRPGWHIECSALAAHYLGKHIDIHAGGLDLVFPHHENEIAQSEALYGAPFARYWVHNGLVRINEEKMSKSLGNFFTLRDVFKHFDPMVIRFYILSHHYHAPMEFSFDDIRASEKSYRRLCRVFEAVNCDEILEPVIITESVVVQRMLDYLIDDLNTPGMFGVLFEKLNALQEDHEELCRVRAFLVNVLGLDLKQLPEREVEMTPEIEQLLRDREQARADKDWAKSDAIRDKLHAMGVEIKDSKLK